MNIYFVLLQTSTAVNTLTGFCLTVFLFSLCFIVVHFVRLAFIGWKASVKRVEPVNEEKEKTPAPKSKEREQIFYIVEKKRAKPKTRTTYSEPKEFQFKSTND